ncbi:hypothetical protein HNQ74_001658, partial [Bartonella doshiae]
MINNPPSLLLLGMAGLFPQSHYSTAEDIQAHKGSLHGFGADIFAGTNSAYSQGNDAQSGNITLEAGQDITFESAQNTQSTQNNMQSASM